MDTNSKTNKDSLMHQIGNTEWCGRMRPRDGKLGMTTFIMIHTTKTIKYIVGANNLSQYNQYFL
jgi:hypothetical protein